MSTKPLNSIQYIKNLHLFRNLTEEGIVEEVRLYGSRARGDNEERADIDLAISCPKATQKDWYNILGMIEEADTLLKIDCVRLDTLPDNSALKASIVTQGIILYHKPETQI